MAPTETFRASRGDSLGSAFRYYTILLVIWAVLAAIVWMVMGYLAFQDALIRIRNMGVFGRHIAEALTSFGAFVATFQLFIVYVLFFLSLVGVFFIAFFWHIFALLFGAKREFAQTIKTTMYAATPFFLLVCRMGSHPVIILYLNNNNKNVVWKSISFIKSICKICMDK